jgi:DNA repair protein SbcD/Mre11
MSDALKFIHASDLHLDRPLDGLAELPSHLKSTLADAPFAAATRIFDAAITEKVDFVLLAGDVLDLESAGPRALSFLLQQFERMRQRNIHIYWVAGKDDSPDRWPTAIDLPDNVTTVSSNVVEQFTHRRNGQTVATIFASGFESQRRVAGDFQAHVNDPFPIALAYGQWESGNLSTYNIRYWALGGEHKRNITEKNGVYIAYPGTAQARSIDEAGPNGCTLGIVDANGKIQLRFIESDSVRWIQQKIVAAESVDTEELKNILTERAIKISSSAREQTCLVNWLFSPTGTFNPDIRHQAWRQEITQWLRKEFGQAIPAVWTTEFNVEPPKSLPQTWYEEDTMLGDYVRSVGRYQSDETLAISLNRFLPASIQDDQLATLGRIDSASRARILQQSTLVGLEYLSEPEQVNS